MNVLKKEKSRRNTHNNKKGTNFFAKTEDPDDKIEDSSDDEGFSFLQHDIVCSTQEEVRIPRTWILLDSQSTVDVFSNLSLLMTICNAKWNLVLYCNARQGYYQ